MLWASNPGPQHIIPEGCHEATWAARRFWGLQTLPLQLTSERAPVALCEDRKPAEANLDVTVWSPCFQLALLFQKRISAVQR